MKAKQVRETASGKSISAWVILKKGKHIATVQAHFGDSVVTVDVWDNYIRVHSGKAGGYGYDKFTAALSGAVIDGCKIFDNCGTDINTVKILEKYLAGKLTLEQASWQASKIGAYFTNWSDSDQKYKSIYYSPGLDRLKGMGYTLIQAI